MKEITYNNKVYKLPFAVSLPEDPTAEEEISNRFNGEKAKLPAFAVAVYDVIMGSEMLKQWDDHRKGLDWFIKFICNVSVVGPLYKFWPHTFYKR